VLARRLEGAFAARFLAAAAVAGLAVLAAIAPGGSPPWAQVGLALWPVALLAALEMGAPAPVPAAADHPSASGAGILHDLRSPLSVVRVYADLLQERVRRGEPVVAEHLGNLLAELELMERLVAGTGRGPRASAARVAPALDLGRVATDLAARYRAAHGDKVVVETIVERPRVLVRADEVAVQRVLRNVLENAVQYTPPGGTISVRVTADDTHGEVAVADDGIGMSAEDRAHAFDPAYRGRGGRALREGSGLGLAVSRELVESMGGRISLRSEEERGSEVRIALPLAAAGS
ncbi:MAG TPA: sensor histidine kinase, partial [Vicinamibacteria bacterium]|nr:sensor histidine kinase [Vicinamibacteria bacterium]